MQMLNLDDEKAIDYSSETPLLPFDCIGEYDLAILAYVELVDEDEKERRIKAGADPDSVRAAFNGACDIATVQVLTSTNDSVRKGSVFGLYFDTHAKGKAKAFAAARLRQFIASAVGEAPKSNFRANDARAALLSTDLTGGEARVHLSRRSRAGRGDYEGQTFANDVYTPLAE
jgi:hypothetical protein